MTLRHVSTGAELLSALNTAQGGDTIHLRRGVYPVTIDDRALALRGGSGFASKLTIARCPSDATQPCVIEPTAGSEFALYLSKPSSSFIEFQGLTFDGSHVLYDALKFTNASYDPLVAGPHHVRVRDCVVKNAPGNGVLTTNSHNHTFKHTLFYRNGGTDRLRHGMYLSGYENLVSQCDFNLNAGGGCEVWDGTVPPLSYDNRVEYCRSWNNAQSKFVVTDPPGDGNGYGIGGGGGNVVYRCMAWANVIGFQVGYNSTGCVLQENLSYGNSYPWPPAGSSADYYFDPGETGTVVKDCL